MVVRRVFLGTLVSAMAMVLSPAPVHAGAFSVSPVRVDLSARVATGALTIRNQQDADVAVEAQAVLWEQVEGVDQLTPTRDVLVSPVVFTLSGHGAQLVRVALQRPADAQRELSYRLILTEVPAQPAAGSSGLNVALRLSLPIFVEPLAPAQPILEWTAARSGDDTLSITARNTGGAHARVLDFAGAPLTNPDSVVVAHGAAYVLPDQIRTWPLKINQMDGTSGTDWHRLRLKGTTEAGDFTVEISSEDG